MNTVMKLKPLGALVAGLAFCGGSALAADNADTSKKDDGTLPAVEVNGNREAPAYMATKTRVGKVEQDPHAIPQAVTTVTSTILEEQQASSLQEAMRNVAGISFNAAEGGRAGDNMNLRGFYTFGDMYLDGIRDTAQYNRETFNLEQLDVLRGAGAMLFGRGQAGGVINQVTKTPLEFDQYRLTASTGSQGYRQFTADLNKAVSEDTGLRVNLMDRADGSWRSNPDGGATPDIQRSGAAISLALNQASNHKLWLNHYYIRTNDNPDYGVPFDSVTRKPATGFRNNNTQTGVLTGIALPSSYFWGTTKTFDKSDTSMSTLVHQWQIDDVSQLRTQLRYANYDRSYWAKTPSISSPPNASGGRVGTGGAAAGNVTRMAYYDTVTLQSDYSRTFDTMGMKHQLLAGVDYLYEDSWRNSLKNFGTALLPDYRPYQTSTSTPSRFSGDSYAVYAQDTVEFIPKWRATAGARRDQMNAKYSNGANLNYGEWSYRSSLSYHPTDESHYYLAYSDSFSPTADLYQLTITPKPPERSDVVELGAKYILLEGDLTLRGALYRATKVWERNADLEATTAPILTKKRRTDGIEVEAAGRITRQWEVFAGVALMDATILDVADGAAAGLVGQRARNTPRYTYNLWTTYKVDDHWKVGAGVEAKGDRYAYVPSSATLPTLPGGTAFHPNTAPAYERVDALVSYEQLQWAVKLNVKNVFDKLYYDSVYDNGGFTVPGLRRTVIVTAEFKY